MSEWVNECLWLSECVCVSEWVNEWMNEWMNEWTNEWTNNLSPGLCCLLNVAVRAPYLPGTFSFRPATFLPTLLRSTSFHIGRKKLQVCIMVAHSDHRLICNSKRVHFPLQKLTFLYGNALTSTERTFLYRNAFYSTETHFPLQKNSLVL